MGIAHDSEEDSSIQDVTSAKQAKKSKAKPTNYYAPLSKTPSSMSKAKRHKLKAIQRKHRTYFTLKI